MLSNVVIVQFKTSSATKVIKYSRLIKYCVASELVGFDVARVSRIWLSNFVGQ